MAEHLGANPDYKNWQKFASGLLSEYGFSSRSVGTVKDRPVINIFEKNGKEEFLFVRVVRIEKYILMRTKIRTDDISALPGIALKKFGTSSAYEGKLVPEYTFEEAGKKFEKSSPETKLVVAAYAITELDALATGDFMNMEAKFMGRVTGQS